MTASFYEKELQVVEQAKALYFKAQEAYNKLMKTEDWSYYIKMNTQTSSHTSKTETVATKKVKAEYERALSNQKQAENEYNKYKQLWNAEF